jgi:hypothetical protein
MNEKALKKILLTMLKDEYPQIKDIHISSTDLGYTTLYQVGIGIKYDDLPETREENQLKSRVVNLSKYILDNRGMIEKTYFYDPT